MRDFLPRFLVIALRLMLRIGYCFHSARLVRDADLVDLRIMWREPEKTK